MIRLDLELHPGSVCEAVDAIEVAAEREGDLLRLRYVVTGRLEGVAVPPPAAPERTDGLWRHTCFEAFVRSRGGDGYIELNLSPSGVWAAYEFDSYREGMRDLDMAAPRVGLERSAGMLVLGATVLVPVAGPWQVALAAVIEEEGGRRSWWAARHPRDTPDFHHPESFVREIQ